MNLVAYLGPETMLPMTSVLAGVLGFFMMFGRKAFDLVAGVVRKKPAVAAPKTRARGHRPTASRVAAGRPDGDARDAEDSLAA